jgi:hypothetical protein
VPEQALPKQIKDSMNQHQIRITALILVVVLILAAAATIISAF